MKLISILFLLLLSACNVVDIEDYIHEPTNDIRHAYIYSHHDQFDKLTDEDFLVVPNFRTFSKSFSSPYAKLLFLSKTEVKVEVLSVELVAGSKSKVVPVDEIVEISRSRENTSYYYSSVIVLRERDLDIVYWNSLSSFTLKVSYRAGRETVQCQWGQVLHFASRQSSLIQTKNQ
jgi:hypothetical protein